MTTMTMIHDVRLIELTEAKFLVSAGGPFWRRTLTVIDSNGNQTQITLLAATEEQLQIKEKT
jgi:hypothetical protein